MDKRILIVIEQSVLRESLAAALAHNGYRTAQASHGREALDVARAEEVDLIILDLDLPVMPGLELLRQLRNDPDLTDTPVVVLTETAHRDQVIQAARLGVRDIIVHASFTLRDLFERVAKRLSGETTPADETSAPDGSLSADASSSEPDLDPHEALKQRKPICTRQRMLDLLKACSELKAFSPTVTQLMAQTGSERGNAEEVARTIKQDHAIAIKILKLANSSVYTRGEPVDTLEKAVLRIGLGQIRQLLLNISVVDNFNSQTSASHINLGHFWEHSIGCGLIASQLAQPLGQEAADSAFTMGLVHDIGRVIYSRQLGEQYTQVMQMAEELRLPLEVVESRLLILNHADGMDALLHAWKFPKELIDPIVFHHLSMGNIRRMAPRRVQEVATLALANRLCHALAIGSSGNDVIYPIEEYCEAMRIEPRVLQQIEETSHSAVENLKLALLSRSTDSGWADKVVSWQESLGGSFRPLFVGEKPHFDAFRMFVDQISGNTSEAPNVGIIHMRNARDRAALSQAYVEAELAADARDLPVIVLSPSGKLDMENSAAKGREVQLLSTPVPVAVFIDALSHAVNQRDEVAKAA